MAKEKRQRKQRATAGMEPAQRFGFQTGQLVTLIQKYLTKAKAFGKEAHGDDKIGTHFAGAVAELEKAQDAINKLPEDFNPLGGFQRRVLSVGDIVTLKEEYAATYTDITKPGDKLTVEKVSDPGGKGRAIVLIVKNAKGQTIPLAKNHVEAL